MNVRKENPSYINETKNEKIFLFKTIKDPKLTS